MITDINLKEEICFDNLNKNTSNVDVFQGTNLLENIKKELNKVPLELREPFITDLYQHIPHAAMEGTDTTKTGDKIIPPKIPIFGWRGAPELLALMMWEFQDQLKIFTDPHMVDVFVRMATSKDLSQENGKMHFACKTIIYSYIIKQLEPYFISFNPTTIERYGMFVRKAGNPITANCLYNSKTKNVSLIKIIDAIIKKYC